MMLADKIGQLTAGATRGEGIERVMIFFLSCESVSQLGKGAENQNGNLRWHLP